MKNIDNRLEVLRKQVKLIQARGHVKFFPEYIRTETAKEICLEALR